MTTFVITYHHGSGSTSTLTTRQPTRAAAEARAKEHMHRAIKAGRVNLIVIKPAEG